MASFINRKEELHMCAWHTLCLGVSRHFTVSEESPSHPVWPGTESWVRLMRRKAGIWFFLISKREWSQRGQEGPLKVVTKLANPNNKAGKGGRCEWGRLAMVSGFPGLDDGNKGFHYTILSTFVFKILSPKIENENVCRGWSQKKEKKFKKEKSS